jgi:hypothetical protein
VYHHNEQEAASFRWRLNADSDHFKCWQKPESLAAPGMTRAI